MSSFVPKNIFVLMLENHSFDHLLGMSQITGRDAVTGAQTAVNGLTNEVNHFDRTTYPVSSPAVDPMTTDPGHEFLDTLEQLAGPGVQNPFPNGPYPAIDSSGFVANYATTTSEGPAPGPAHRGDVMAACDSRAQVPALYSLAREFAVCDNWFSSMPGPTWPNRFFAMGASSGGLDDSPSTLQMIGWQAEGFKLPHGSIFDLLRVTGHPWRIYSDKSDSFSTNPSMSGGMFPIASFLHNVHHSEINDFKNLGTDLRSPYPYRYTWIEPNYGDVVSGSYRGGSSQHPMDSLAAGDALIAATYEAIRNSPVWETSLLVVVYDEHGGFYDHVAPPPAPSPDDSSGGRLNRHGFDFTQLGVRVPAVVVSPRVPANTVDHTVYDHTSILKTVEEVVGVGSLTERDKAAQHLLHLLSLETPRTDCPTSIGVTNSKRPPGGGETLDHAPLPDAGNVHGFLMTALKHELSLLPPDDVAAREAARNRVGQLETRGEAQAYLAGVAARLAVQRS